MNLCWCRSAVAAAFTRLALAEELEIDRVLVPRFPGVLSAAGLLAAPIEHEVSSSYHATLAEASTAAIREACDALDRGAAALMEREHVQDLAIRRRHAADMAYMGQSHLIEVNLDFTADEPLSAFIVPSRRRMSASTDIQRVHRRRS